MKRKKREEQRKRKKMAESYVKSNEHQDPFGAITTARQEGRTVITFGACSRDGTAAGVDET